MTSFMGIIAVDFFQGIWRLTALIIIDFPNWEHHNSRMAIMGPWGSCRLCVVLWRFVERQPKPLCLFPFYNKGNQGVTFEYKCKYMYMYFEKNMLLSSNYGDIECWKLCGAKVALIIGIILVNIYIHIYVSLQVNHANQVKYFNERWW